MWSSSPAKTALTLILFERITELIFVPCFNTSFWNNACVQFACPVFTLDLLVSSFFCHETILAQDHRIVFCTWFKSMFLCCHFWSIFRIPLLWESCSLGFVFFCRVIAFCSGLICRVAAPQCCSFWCVEHAWQHCGAATRQNDSRTESNSTTKKTNPSEQNSHSNRILNIDQQRMAAKTHCFELSAKKPLESSACWW